MHSLSTVRLIILGVAAAALVSCAPGLQPLTPELQEQRGDYDGYSMGAPPGSDWSIGTMAPRAQLYLRRPPGQPQYSAIFQASIKQWPRAFTSYEELRAFVAESHAREPDIGRFKNKTYAYTPDLRYPACVRWRMEAEDYGAPNKGELPYLWMVGIVLACPHPDRPGLIVIVDTSQRAPASVGTAEFERMAGEFLAGLTFRRP